MTIEENKLASKIFIASMLLQELLDETSGNPLFKHRLRYHINELQGHMDKMLGVYVNDETVLKVLSMGVNALDQIIDGAINQVEP